MHTDNGAGDGHYPFSFSGSGYEYFKIWIVNILLTIITLGIYSAWAKVRTNQYFYRNTRLADAGFDYHAKPLAILKGRLIAIAALTLYSTINYFLPLLGLALALLFAVLIPWIIVKALAFNMRYTSYRNIRFDFRQNYRQAIIVYILIGLLMVLSFGLLYPFYRHAATRFLVTNTVYGRTPLRFDASVEGFFRGYVFAFISVFGFVLAAGVLAALIYFLDMPGAIIPVVFSVGFIAGYVFMFAYIEANISNITFDGISTAGEADVCRLSSDLKVGHIFWLYVSNTLFVFVTLGIFIPWAKVRLVQYKLSRLQLQAAQGLDHFVAGQVEQSSALGEQVGEVFDVDIGL
jgi:uncharacterized membrane protein YjgN (DUF898 family)